MNGIKLLGRQGHRSHRASVPLGRAGERQTINKYFQVVVIAMKDSKVGEEGICAEREL